MIEASWEAQALPAGATHLLKSLAAVLGQPRFILFGGATLDLLQEPAGTVKDLDVALPHDPALVEPCVGHLRRSGCVPQADFRRYWINLDQPVLMLEVRWDDYVIDLNFVDQIERIPQFDIEGVIWRYPELDYVDLYAAFDALARRTVRPVHGLDQNNPYLLMNRMIRLAAKYSLCLADNAVHQQIVTGLSERIATWCATDDFHGRQAVEAHHRSIAGSVFRAADSAAYLVDLTDSAALRNSVPELHRLLSTSPEPPETLTKASNSTAFWSAACSLMLPDEARSLSTRLAAAGSPPEDLHLPLEETR